VYTVQWNAIPRPFTCNNSSYCLCNYNNNNNYNTIHGQNVGLNNIIIYYNIVLCTFTIMIVLPAIIILCIKRNGKFGYLSFWWFRYFYFFLIAIASMTKLIIIFETFDFSAFVYTIIVTPRTSNTVATVRCSEAIMALYAIIIILLHARWAVYFYYCFE